MVSQDDIKSMEFSNMFNCCIGKWPIKYLGVPISSSRLHVTDWFPIEEKVQKACRMEGSTLSLGSRLTL
jgi:hypothetical protein